MEKDTGFYPIGSLASFYVVTKPKTKGTGLNDICFESTPRGIGLQFKGGLENNDIVGFYTDKEAARELAMEILRKWRAFCEVI